MKKAVLLLSTDATRTGTPVLLLNTLKWLKNNCDHRFVLILHEGGELLEEFRKICDVYLWPYHLVPGVKIQAKNALIKIGKTILYSGKLLMCKLFLLKLKALYSIRLVYSNTARNGEILFICKKFFPVRTVLHVHEGERTLSLFNSGNFVTYSLEISDVIITVSESVKKVLQEKYKIHKKIDIIPGGIESGYVFGMDARDLLRKEGIPDDRIVLMSCGWLDWHKGTDIFIHIARSLSEQNEKLHFVWIGGHSKAREYRHLRYDIEKLNLSGKVTLLSSRPNSLDYLNGADVVLMLSREESFSLVTLEAGLARKPVLCFDGSGGPQEIVNYDARFIVPYIDIEKMKERIKEILADNEKRIQMGDYLHERVIKKYTIEKCASSIMRVIDQEVSTS